MTEPVVPVRGHVAILLATHNGARHLHAQLDSIRLQTHRDWTLFVSDDHSTDATLAGVADFASEVGAERVQVRLGPGRGFVANYLGLACADDVEADYFAFCDQDDVWLPGKLEHALVRLQEPVDDAQHPARLYGGRTVLVDEAGAYLGLSRRWLQPPSFRNALVQSLAGANTMVFNAAARDLLRRAGADVAAASHDWWLYQLVTGVAGAVHYDPVPWVHYRQHGANVQGTNRGVTPRLRRLGELLGGRMRAWNAAHCEGLQRVEALLTEDNRRVLTLFRQARACAGMASLLRFRATGCRRQQRIDNVALGLAAVLGRL